MGASDRFLFLGGISGSGARVLADARASRRAGLIGSTHHRSSVVLKSGRGPIQLSLFAAFEPDARKGLNAVATRLETPAEGEPAAA